MHHFQTFLQQIQNLNELASSFEAEVHYCRLDAVLNTLATLQTTCTYRELEKALGIVTTRLAAMLGRRMEDDHANGEPLSSALIVNRATGRSSPGFFVKARSLGYGVENEEEFWNEQCVACYAVSIADALYRAGRVFRSHNRSNAETERLCKIAEHAIRNLWHRLWLEKDAWATNIRTSKAGDFLIQHTRLEGYVEHIAALNKKYRNALNRFAPPGCAAAMCYLMACSATPQDRALSYHASLVPPADDEGTVFKPQPESTLDWSLEQQARDFWTSLATSLPGEGKASDSPLRAVCDLIRPWNKEDQEPGASYFPANRSASGAATLLERWAILAKAWALYSTGKKVTAAEIQPTYLPPNELGEGRLDDFPTLGGLDRGEPDAKGSVLNAQDQEDDAALV